MKLISKEAAQGFLPDGFPMDSKFPSAGAGCGEEHVKRILSVVWPILVSYRRVLVAQKAMSSYTALGMFSVGDRDTDHLGVGHVFLIDYPGKGKTLLAKVPASVVRGGEGETASRFQGVQDALPADYLGGRMIDFNSETGKREFVLVRGPGFAYIQLLDEINRLSTRTQSAVLQVLSEGTITIGTQTYHVNPFVVLTANPVEQEGTYPLSEAFRDRIMFQVRGEEFSAANFVEIMERTRSYHKIHFEEICDVERVNEVRRFFHETIHVSDEVAERVGRFAEKINAPHQFGLLKDLEAALDGHVVKTAISGRGIIHLEGAARTLAAFRYRNFVTPDDFRKVLLPVLRHRMIFEPGVLKRLQYDYKHRDTLETTDFILNQLIQEAW